MEEVSATDAACHRPLSEADSIDMVAPIYFDFGAATIRSDAGNTLSHKKGLLDAIPEIRLRAEGHAGPAENRLANRELSRERAAAARDYLVSIGLPASRIYAVGYSNARPACMERSDTCERLNRRVDFVLIR